MGWDTVKEIHKRYLEKKYSKPVLKDLEMIAIDEIAVGRDTNILRLLWIWPLAR